MKGQMNVKKSALGVQTKTAFNGDTVNRGNPRVMEASPRGKSVPMAPKINAGTGGQAGGAKRVIQSEASPAGKKAYMHKSTFSAPRSDGSSNPVETGYTKLGKA